MDRKPFTTKNEIDCEVIDLTEDESPIDLTNRPVFQLNQSPASRNKNVVVDLTDSKDDPEIIEIDNSKSKITSFFKKEHFTEPTTEKKIENIPQEVNKSPIKLIDKLRMLSARKTPEKPDSKGMFSPPPSSVTVRKIPSSVQRAPGEVTEPAVYKLIQEVELTNPKGSSSNSNMTQKRDTPYQTIDRLTHAHSSLSPLAEVQRNPLGPSPSSVVMNPKNLKTPYIPNQKTHHEVRKPMQIVRGMSEILNDPKNVPFDRNVLRKSSAVKIDPLATPKVSNSLFLIERIEALKDITWRSLFASEIEKVGQVGFLEEKVNNRREEKVSFMKDGRFLMLQNEVFPTSYNAKKSSFFHLSVAGSIVANDLLRLNPESPDLLGLINKTLDKGHFLVHLSLIEKKMLILQSQSFQIQDEPLGEWSRMYKTLALSLKKEKTLLLSNTKPTQLTEEEEKTLFSTESSAEDSDEDSDSDVDIAKLLSSLPRQSAPRGRKKRKGGSHVDVDESSDDDGHGKQKKIKTEGVKSGIKRKLSDIRESKEHVKMTSKKVRPFKIKLSNTDIFRKILNVWEQLIKRVKFTTKDENMKTSLELTYLLNIFDDISKEIYNLQECLRQYWSWNQNVNSFQNPQNTPFNISKRHNPSVTVSRLKGFEEQLKSCLSVILEKILESPEIRKNLSDSLKPSRFSDFPQDLRETILSTSGLPTWFQKLKNSENSTFKAPGWIVAITSLDKFFRNLAHSFSTSESGTMSFYLLLQVGIATEVFLSSYALVMKESGIKDKENLTNRLKNCYSSMQEVLRRTQLSLLLNPTSTGEKIRTSQQNDVHIMIQAELQLLQEQIQKAGIPSPATLTTGVLNAVERLKQWDKEKKEGFSRNTLNFNLAQT